MSGEDEVIIVPNKTLQDATSEKEFENLYNIYNKQVKNPKHKPKPLLSKPKNKPENERYISITDNEYKKQLVFVGISCTALGIITGLIMYRLLQ